MPMFQRPEVKAGDMALTNVVDGIIPLNEQTYNFLSKKENQQYRIEIAAKNDALIVNPRTTVKVLEVKNGMAIIEFPDISSINGEKGYISVDQLLKKNN